MDFKKLAVGAAGAALFLSAVAPTFAFGDGTFILNKSWLKNVVITKADTGGNRIGGKVVGGGIITTGNAGALAQVMNLVNSNSVAIINKSGLKNVVITKADTGDNRIGGKVVGGGDIWTGEAGASSVVTNVVNTTTTE